MLRAPTVVPKHSVNTMFSKTKKAVRLDTKKKRSGTKKTRRVGSSDWD